MFRRICPKSALQATKKLNCRPENQLLHQHVQVQSHVSNTGEHSIMCGRLFSEVPQAMMKQSSAKQLLNQSKTGINSMCCRLFSEVRQAKMKQSSAKLLLNQSKTGLNSICRRSFSVVPQEKMKQSSAKQLLNQNWDVFCFVVAGGLLSCICFRTVPITERKQIILFPLYLEQKNAKDLGDSYKCSRYSLPATHILHKRAQKILDVLKTADGVKYGKHIDFEILLMNYDVKNFIALADGSIVIFAPFVASLSEFESDDFLAAPIAHELAHVIARHASERAQRKYISDFLLAYFCLRAFLNVGLLRHISFAVGVLAKFLDIFTRHISNQNREYEADCMGMVIMTSAGYDPINALKYMELNLELFGNSASHFSTHPPTKERVARLKELYDKGERDRFVMKIKADEELKLLRTAVEEQ